MWWQLSGDFLSYQMEISGSPHRYRAWDYGADVGIDPIIKAGDKVVYYRMEDTAGIWVKNDCKTSEDIDKAVDRVMENREALDEWSLANTEEAYVDVAKYICKTTQRPISVNIGVSIDTGEVDPAKAILAAGWGVLVDDSKYSDRPVAAVSFFLSHAAEDTLLARWIAHDMSSEANADVWLDLNQPKDTVPISSEGLTQWLRDSLYSTEGFLVLWTENAMASEWVQQELEWAKNRSIEDPDFHIIILKLQDVEVPQDIQAVAVVVDCDGIWWSNGINEELYAAIFNREGRRAWLENLGSDSFFNKGNTYCYDDFFSSGGRVVRFDWEIIPLNKSEKRVICWQFDLL